MSEHPQLPIPRVCNCPVDGVAEYAEYHGVEAAAEQYLIGVTTVRRAQVLWRQWQEGKQKHD